LRAAYAVFFLRVLFSPPFKLQPVPQEKFCELALVLARFAPCFGSSNSRRAKIASAVVPFVRGASRVKEVLQTIPRKVIPRRDLGAPYKRNEAIHYSDGTTEIILLRRDGSRIVCLIDTQDYAIIEKFSWSPWVSPDSDIRALTKTGGRTLYIHQLLLPGTDEVDHINRNPLDNTRGNLRPATRSIQGQNQKKRRTGLTSRFIGVYWNKAIGKFHARIGVTFGVNRKRIHLGFFESEIDAARAYNRAAHEYFGEHAQSNVLREAA